jgi:hypothetical protein
MKVADWRSHLGTVRLVRDTGKRGVKLLHEGGGWRLGGGQELTREGEWGTVDRLCRRDGRILYWGCPQTEQYPGQVVCLGRTSQLCPQRVLQTVVKFCDILREFTYVIKR